MSGLDKYERFNLDHDCVIGGFSQGLKPRGPQKKSKWGLDNSLATLQYILR
jgi:hypothetical protein